MGAGVVMMIGVDMAEGDMVEVDTVVVAEEVMMTVVDIVEVVVVMVVIMMVMVEGTVMTIVEVMVVATIEAIDLFSVFVQQAKIICRMKFPKFKSLFQKDVGDLTTVHLLYIYHFVLKILCGECFFSAQKSIIEC